MGVYIPNWQPEGLIEQVPPGNLTHVLYAFLRLCGPGQLPKDAAACEGKRDFELAVSPLEARFDQVFARYKQRAPHLQVLASVGGWGGSDPFFHLAQNPAGRAAFVASAQRFLREHPAFDGIDIDWEHPGDNSAVNGVKLGSPADGQAYADLLTDLRQSLDALGRETGRRYLVTMAVNTMSPIVQRINFRQAADALDLVFMMTYDFYGGWSPVAGHHSTLASSSPEADDSLRRSVRNLQEAGVPTTKMVAGGGHVRPRLHWRVSAAHRDGQDRHLPGRGGRHALPRHRRPAAGPPGSRPRRLSGGVGSGDPGVVAVQRLASRVAGLRRSACRLGQGA